MKGVLLLLALLIAAAAAVPDPFAETKSKQQAQEAFSLVERKLAQRVRTLMNVFTSMLFRMSAGSAALTLIAARQDYVQTQLPST
jgi:hypothetical protein